MEINSSKLLVVVAKTYVFNPQLPNVIYTDLDEASRVCDQCNQGLQEPMFYVQTLADLWDSIQNQYLQGETVMDT
jgi:hypothetical protein